MAASTRRETAKIYQFPRRPRIADTAPPRADRADPAAFGVLHDYGAWYHEAAIQEDGRHRKP